MIIDKTRKLRNRIFHYEPIFNQENLEQLHKDIINILGWLSTDLQKLNITFDRFNSIEIEKKDIVTKLEKLHKNTAK